VLEVPRGRLRQRLREWDDEAGAKRGKKRREVQVQTCFADLLSWIIQSWQGEHRLAFALDASTLGERFPVLSVSVLFRGCAIPVAWRILRAKEEGEWRGPIETLFASVQGVIPEDWHVIVMADRGVYAPWLYQTIQRLGWHPVLRVKEGMSVRAEGEEQACPIGERVKHHGRRWCGRGVWSTQGTPLSGTLVVRWEAGYEETLAVGTDLVPEEAEGAWDQMRFWIEDEFTDEKRGGWHWEQTKMNDPERAQRRWLAMAVATQWVVKVGGEQEAQEQVRRGKKPPARRTVGRPAKQFHRPCGRELSCCVRGQQAISAAVAQGRPVPTGRLVAEPWPTKLYAVGKPPSSWANKRTHKEERTRQRKRTQAEAKRQQRSAQQAQMREERMKRQSERRITKAQHAREQAAQRQQHRDERARERDRQREQRTQEQKDEQERKREARRQRHVEQEQLRLQRKRWHEECEQARQARQDRRHDRLARQTLALPDPPQPGPVRPAHPP